MSNFVSLQYTSQQLSKVESVSSSQLLRYLQISVTFNAT